MKRPINLVLHSLLFTLPLIGNSQQDSALVSKVIHRVEKAIADCDPCQYSAAMRFKSMETDTFEIRHFTIRYRSNPDNPLYGYDWEVAEKLTDGFTYTWMALPTGLYRMYEGNKIMNHFPLPAVIELGSYPETMRDYFMLSENILHFTHYADIPVSVIDSNTHYYLKRQMNEYATREIAVSKATNLPVQFTTTISTDIGLTQILNIHLHYTDSCRIMPASAFSPAYYTTAGYTPPVPTKKEVAAEEVKTVVAPANMALLLNYPFITASGDTTVINSSEAAYMVLDFWFAGCFPCLRAMPTLNQLAERYADAGLLVYGINCFDKKSSATLVSKMRSKDISFPMLFGENDLVQKLGIRAFPTYLIVTPERNIEIIPGGIDGVKQMLEEIFGK